jgi:hypothetical protein
MLTFANFLPLLALGKRFIPIKGKRQKIIKIENSKKV